MKINTQFAAFVLACGLLINGALTAAAGPAKTGGSKPPTPTNFRVTAKTAYTVTVTWDAVATKTGDFSYHLSGAYQVMPAVLPKTATSHTFTSLFPSNEYWFFIYAKSSTGSVSGQASATTRTLSDTTPPTTAPVVTINEVGANYAVISWTPAQDDGPHLSTQIYLNGAFYQGAERGITTATLRFLKPGTTYSLTARAVDFGNNAGPFSNPISLTTPSPNPNDTTPPTVPANLTAFGTGDGSTETHINWAQSTDDFDAQQHIRYDVYVNGVFQDVLFGSGGTSLVYAEFGENVIEVTATDTSGNTSAPATATVTF